MKESRYRNKNKVKFNTVSRVLIILLTAVFLFSVYKLVTIFRSYKADSSSYDAVRELVTDDIDWAELKEINPDVVGWIRLPGSNIDYPIVQGNDNDRYLTTLFDGSPGNAGAIFVDADATDPFHQFNTVVYGHHMKDGSMFNNLKKFRDIEFAEAHRSFELYTPEEDYRIELAAFLNCPADSPIYASDIGTDSRDQFFDFVRNNAEYITDIPMTNTDRYVVLSTCAYEYEGARYVIVGKLTPWS